MAITKHFPVKFFMMFNPATPNPCPGNPGEIGVRRLDILVSSGYGIEYDAVGEMESCQARLRTRIYVQFAIGSLPPALPGTGVNFRVYRISPHDTHDSAFFVDRGFQPYPRDTLAIGNVGLIAEWIGGGLQNSLMPITDDPVFGPLSLWDIQVFGSTPVPPMNPSSPRGFYNIEINGAYKSAKDQGHQYMTWRLREIDETPVATDYTKVQWHAIGSAASVSTEHRPMLIITDNVSTQPTPVLPVTLELGVLEPCVLNLGLAIPNVPAMLDFQRMGITPVRRGNTVGVSVILVDHLTVPPKPVNGVVLLTLRDQSGTPVLTAADMHRVGAGTYRYSYWTKDTDPLTLYTAEFDYVGAATYQGPAQDGL